MKSEPETSDLPSASAGRAARRAAERTGRGRRGRRRSRLSPVVTAAAVVGTAVVGAVVGAGYAALDHADGDGTRTIALDGVARDADGTVAIKAEAGDRNGIQVPGAGGADPAYLAAVVPSPTAGAEATPSAGATTPGATPSTAAGPSAGASGSPKPSASTTSTSARPSATGSSGKAATTPAPAPAGPYAQQVADLVNAERAKAGCGPLSVDAKLTAAAQSHSEDMANRGYFDHASPEGHHADHRIEAAGYRWSAWGENIARGQKDPAAVMNAWMNSPGHRANILNCSFKQIGVGVRTGSGGPWWTQVFGTPA